MIRHIRGLGPTLKNPPPASEAALPFVQDDVLPRREPRDEVLLRGKALYELSCGRCHGNSPDRQPQVGGRGHGLLSGSRYVFFKMIEDGSNPANPRGWNIALAYRDAIYDGLGPVNFQPHHQPYNYFANYAPGTKTRETHLNDLADF